MTEAKTIEPAHALIGGVSLLRAHDDQIEITADADRVMVTTSTPSGACPGSDLISLGWEWDALRRGWSLLVQR